MRGGGDNDRLVTLSCARSAVGLRFPLVAHIPRTVVLERGSWLC